MPKSGIRWNFEVLCVTSGPSRELGQYILQRRTEIEAEHRIGAGKYERSRRRTMFPEFTFQRDNTAGIGQTGSNSRSLHPSDLLQKRRDFGLSDRAALCKRRGYRGGGGGVGVPDRVVQIAAIEEPAGERSDERVTGTMGVV